MSLPDTVFIFVLALIIFGPKKLPEIGRQLGKLVGEFRRASNEFKFQIEEELRQAELADRNTSSPAKNEPAGLASAEASTEVPDSPSPDLPYPEETLPVGQYPNIDTINPQDLVPTESTEAEAPPTSTHGQAVDDSEPSHPIINPATGTEPRATHPYRATTNEGDAPRVAGEAASAPQPELPSIRESRAKTETSLLNQEPADPYAAPAVVDVTHG